MTEPTDLTDEARARLARRPWPTRPIRPDLRISFEFFPPASDDAATRLDDCMARLAPLGPRFASVTYGAGGSTQDRTIDTIRRLSALGPTPIAGHLTCVGATTGEIDEVLDQYVDAGVRHIVALRGDPPAGSTDGSVPGGYRTAAELVDGIRRYESRVPGLQFEISVAAYPNVHPRAASPTADLDNLKAKFDAGADNAITQFFFEPDVMVRFLERARRSGIAEPIIPGILPIKSLDGVRRFAERCGMTVPEWIDELLGDLGEEPEVASIVAATVAAEQCRHLAEHGVTDLHFYTLNSPDLSAAVCRILDLGAPAPAVRRSERTAS